MVEAISFFTKTINVGWGANKIPFTYWQAIAIVILLFLLVLSLSQFRRHYVDWSLKGAIFGVVFGFILAFIIEGLLIVGGKTAFIQVLGWKNPPKPVSLVLDSGKEKLMQTLGVETSSGVNGVIQSLQSLPPNDLNKIKSIICAP